MNDGPVETKVHTKHVDFHLMLTLAKFQKKFFSKTDNFNEIDLMSQTDFLKNFSFKIKRTLK